MKHFIDVTALGEIETAARVAKFRTADLSEFRAPTPKLLFGERLREINEVEASIAKHGLMTPLKVTRSGDKLIVIDGRKRLTALRRMRFKNTLPRSLVNVPYVIGTEPVPHVLSAQEQYRDMLTLEDKGISHNQIALSLCLTDTQLRELMSIKRLSSRLKTAFLNRTISLQQACAFAAVPWHEAQESLLMSLGPFASAEDILKAITKRGNRTIDIAQHYSNATPNSELENVILMPTPPLKGLGAYAHMAA